MTSKKCCAFLPYLYVYDSFRYIGVPGEKGEAGAIGPPGRDGEKGIRGKRGKRVSFHFIYMSFIFYFLEIVTFNCSKVV